MRVLLNRIYDLCYRFFFEPKSPVDLGICRAVFYGIFFGYYTSVPLYLWGDITPALWKPIWLFEVLNIPAIPTAILQPAYWVWLGALLLSSIGLFTRLVTALSFFIGGYLLCLSQCWGKVSHDDALVVITLGLLACSRCGDSFSLDAVRSNRDAEPSGEYRWPIRAVWVGLSLVFFAAGAAKLRMSGLRWAWSDNLIVTMLRRQYISPELNHSAVAVGKIWWLPRLMAFSTLFFEFFYPLALFSKRMRWIMVPGLVVTVLGFKFMISPDFRQLIYLTLFWIPWEWLLKWVRIRASNHPVILFDGACSFCRTSQRWTEILDPLRFVEWIPLQAPAATPYGISRERLERRMVAVYRQREYEGFNAWKLVLRYHPFVWFLIWLSIVINPWLLLLWALFFIPLTEPVGHRMYDWIAANRFNLPGSTCQKPGKPNLL